MTDYNVLKKLAAQELAEAAQSAGVYMDRLWEQVRWDNSDRAMEFAGRIRDTAIQAAAEALQVAAMAQKLIDMGGAHHD